MKEELVLTFTGVFYTVAWSNGVYLGDFAKDVDGYYYYWPSPYPNGSWPAYALRMIADKLDELNKEWDDEIRSYFEKED